MKKLTCLVIASWFAVGCAQSAPPQPAATPHANLAQLMQAIPFPHSNIIFNAGGEDPEEARQVSEGGGPSGSRYGNVYAGWLEVENAGLAIAETAALLRIPGRVCRNGLPVPLDRADFQQFTDQLEAAGLDAYKAAQTKDLDMMLEVGGTITEACAACHEVYRDTEDGTDAGRCTPIAAQ